MELNLASVRSLFLLDRGLLGITLHIATILNI